MCGITGVWDFENRVGENKLKQMRDLLEHRGPDDKGIFVDGHVGLAHRRLSIIDLSESGRQPMCNENEDKWIVFNGEIYNFKEIREDLEIKGHSFRSNTDTEVVLHAYEEYGPDCLSRFNGMFAFAIWDSVDEHMFLARDRLGIKPLYYYWDEKKLVFASEMKSVLAYDVEKVVDKNVLADYFSNLCVPAPKTILKDLFKLLPGHYIILKNKSLQGRKYWDLEYKENNMSFKDAEKVLIDTLKESIRKRLLSDVPLGAFLSGGMDSSSVVALMSQINDDVKTFSIGFEGQEDELDVARKTAAMHNTDHHEYVVKPAEFSVFPKLVYHADEPFADDSLIPTYIVSKTARKNVTVCLSGDGGDENLAGYERYYKNKIEGYYARMPYLLRNITYGAMSNERWKRIAKIGLLNNDIDRFVKGNEKFLDSEKKELLSFDFQKTRKLRMLMNKDIRGQLNKMLYIDVKTTLPDLFLKKVDTASMANSLEVRVPFLDHNFMEFAASLPVSYKLKGFTGKYILRRAMTKLVPKEVIKGEKKGFSAPVNDWLKGDLKDQLKVIIFSCVKRGYFNKDYVEKLWDQHQKGIFDHHERLWSLASFEIWCRIYLDEIDYRKVLDQ